MALPPNPLHFLLTHPGEMLHKVLTGLSQFEQTTLGLVNQVVGLLFLLGLLTGWREAHGCRLRGVVVVSLGGAVLLSCLFRPEPGLLLAWTPVLAILAAGFLTAWVEPNIEGGAWGRLRIPSGWAQSLTYLAVILLAGFPLFYDLVISRPGPPPRLEQWVQPVVKQTPEEAVVMTDQPFLVAWHGTDGPLPRPLPAAERGDSLEASPILQMRPPPWAGRTLPSNVEREGPTPQKRAAKPQEDVGPTADERWKRTARRWQRKRIP